MSAIEKLKIKRQALQLRRAPRDVLENKIDNLQSKLKTTKKEDIPEKDKKKKKEGLREKLKFIEEAYKAQELAHQPPAEFPEYD